MNLTKTAGMILATALGLTACASSGGSSGGNELAGSIQADGSSTVFPVTEAVAEEFRVEHPNVQITVGVSGTGGGFEKFCGGETDISNASRPIKDSEAANCAAAGIEFTELTVALDGLAVVVNPANDWVDCLTTAELSQIWAPGSKVSNWNQIRPGFPDQPLKLFGPGTDSGTFDYFTDEINGEEGASRSDYTASEDDNTLVTGVSGDKSALAYFGFAYFAENSDKLKLVAVDGGNGCVEPSDESVRDGSYSPLARPLFIYVKHAALAKPEVEAFVRFYIEHADDLVGDVGYTPVDEATIAEDMAELEAAINA
ncbi:MAG: PstS family phosphate ABC transporter substrate-binding protein [Actinomycetota bacterium]